MNGALRSLEALFVLALGVGMGALALSSRYEVLMNPAYRWVTFGGAFSIVAMGIALFASRGRTPNRGALIVLALLFGLAIAGRPTAMNAVVLAPSTALPAGFAREGYDELDVQALCRGDTDATTDAAGATRFAAGRLYRTAELEKTGHAILLAPAMACCLADAIAFGVRVKLPADPKPTNAEAWYYVFGRLRRLDAPVRTPPFRFGSIAFSSVDDAHVLDAEEILDYRSMLADVTEKIPREECGAFLRALEDTGLLERLKGDGPFTVFAPIDRSFTKVLTAAPTERFDPGDHAQLRRYLESFLVPGIHNEASLYERTALETMSGRTLEIENDLQLRIGEARLLFVDQLARNGVVHVIHPAWPPAGASR